MMDDEASRRAIGMRQPVEAAIEDSGERVPAARHHIPARGWLLLVMLFEDHRGQRGRKRQRTEAGDRRRHRDGDGELLEKLPGNAADEGGRHEHGAKHQCDRDQRATDLGHGQQSCLAPALPFGEMPLDILHHDDGIIDHDADRKHEAEQREIVDREAERGHDRKGTNQRHRNGDDRNDRRPPALQEHQHDDHDQHHGLVNRLDQLMHRLRDEFGRIVADIVFETFREFGLQLRHGLGDRVRRGQRIRSRPLRDGERHRRLFKRKLLVV